MNKQSLLPLPLVCVCIYGCMCVSTCGSVSVCVSMCLPVCLRPCVSLCVPMCSRVYLCLSVSMYLCVHVGPLHPQRTRHHGLTTYKHGRATIPLRKHTVQLGLQVWVGEQVLSTSSGETRGTALHPTRSLHRPEQA